MESLILDVEPSSEALFDVALLASKKKSMKRLTCRKCEGHGIVSILKGHASACPFNNCMCSTCHSVMNMRANALVRRFKHRQPGQPQAVLKTIRSKNGNMRLKIVARSGVAEEDGEGTTITYSDDSKAHSHYSSVSRRSSAASSSFSSSNNTFRTTSSASMHSSIPCSTNNSSPAVSPPLLSPCLSVASIASTNSVNSETQPSTQINSLLEPLLTATLIQQLLSNYQQSLLGFSPTSAFSIVNPTPFTANTSTTNTTTSQIPFLFPFPTSSFQFPSQAV